eukprot:TRINITY_DN810_c0_g1_i1.p1 TRINITY_DN810_c0_g1~~TRINITY_DN810_c0_g1_i1.p1  ORF type:complete len:695 (+),score=269.85 TRINITY_DN810_c0_g1_i1:67-2151(+)
MTTVSKDEFSLANCSEQVSILKDLLDDDSKELEQYIDAFIEKFQENRYVAAQRNRTALMDPDFISLVVAKGPELLPVEKYLNFVTIFCSIDHGERMLLKAGVVKTLKKALQKGPDAAREAAARAIALLSEDPASRTELGQEGLDELLHTSLHGTERSKQCGLVALANAVYDDDRNKVLICEHMPELLEMISASKDQAIVTYGLLLLRNMSRYSPVKDHAVRWGLMKHISEYMREYRSDESIQVLALWCLVNLTACHVINKQELALSSSLGAIELVVKAMTTHPRNEEVQEMGSVLLGLLAKSPQGRDALILSPELVPHLLSSLKAHISHSLVLRAATRTLWRIAHHSEGRARLGMAGAVPVILELLLRDRIFPGHGALDDDQQPVPDPVLTVLVCRLLKKMSQDELNKEMVKEDGGIEALAHVWRGFKKSSPIKRFILNTMCTIFDEEELKDLDLEGARPDAHNTSADEEKSDDKDESDPVNEALSGSLDVEPEQDEESESDRVLNSLINEINSMTTPREDSAVTPVTHDSNEPSTATDTDALTAVNDELAQITKELTAADALSSTGDTLTPVKHTPEPEVAVTPVKHTPEPEVAVTPVKETSQANSQHSPAQVTSPEPHKSPVPDPAPTSEPSVTQRNKGVTAVGSATVQTARDTPKSTPTPTPSPPSPPVSWLTIVFVTVASAVALSLYMRH